jgi:ATP-dependent Lhr-like helicase
MRFLLHWQRVTPDKRGEGPEALAAVLTQLEGFESAASAWESELLPARLQAYDPAWLDSLCLSGRFVWTRLMPGMASQGPVKSTPIALVRRKQLSAWPGGPASAETEKTPLSGAAQRVRETLERSGALFFEELAESSGLLKTQTEAALAELVGRGLVHADSFKGLRALLVPEDKKTPLSRRQPVRHRRGRTLGLDRAAFRRCRTGFH